MIKYELIIVETSKDSLKDKESYPFNESRYTFDMLVELTNYLKERYGKVIKRTLTNTIFEDDEYGTPVEQGFTHTFWNSDMQPDSKSWRQTDYVYVHKLDIETIMIN